MASLSASDWDSFLCGHPEAHLLQSSDWGELKSEFGWKAARVQKGDCGAQVLFRTIPLGFSIAYIPKGPVGKGWSSIWSEVDNMCRARRAVFLRVEPDTPENFQTSADFFGKGFQPGAGTIQPRQTIEINLEHGEEAWMARMKQKTRYNIRLAVKKGVEVHPSDDIGAFNELMRVTAGRDGFGVHHPGYYLRAYELFHLRNECELLTAAFQGRMLAALMVFARGERSWYLYGASSDEDRSLMPAYLLQLEAMRWAAGRGCRIYDLWGVPDETEEKLESNFETCQDGLWGVYRFKRGFGGQLVRSAGAWDRVYYPLFYKLLRRRLGEG